MQQLPRFNTPEYYQAVSSGLISWEQAELDQVAFNVRSKRAKDAKNNRAIAPHRHNRPAPQENKQYCKNMSTTAARDDRLTPQAKVLLQIITARTGNGNFTETTKTTLGNIINRCARSVQRYIQELVRFDYVITQTRINAVTGLYTGLHIWITQKVVPFFTFKNQEDMTENRRKPEETRLSPIKDKNIKKKFSGKQTEELRKKVDDG